MTQPNATLGLFDLLAAELQAHLSKGPLGNANVSRSDGNEDPTSSDLIWWSWNLSIDPGCRVIAGATLEAWTEICGPVADASSADLSGESLGVITAAVQDMARSRFGSEVSCSQAERAEAPPAEWSLVTMTVTRDSGADVAVLLSVSPDLERALGVPEDDPEASEERDLHRRGGAGRNSADILMDVEMPVSICLGRTKMRMKDLLHLANGSVVELDQELGDEVEIRVNNCFIAYGEVVAVDGNYAVRILRMATARSTPDLRGVLPERAA